MGKVNRCIPKVYQDVYAEKVQHMCKDISFIVLLYYTTLSKTNQQIFHHF